MKICKLAHDFLASHKSEYTREMQNVMQPYEIIVFLKNFKKENKTRKNEHRILYAVKRYDSTNTIHHMVVIIVKI